MQNDHGLTVRHTKRHEIALDALVEVEPAHHASVRLTPQAAAVRGVINVTVVDASGGGLGVLSPVFLPRKTLVRLRIPCPTDEKAPSLLDTALRVQRSVMTDRRPAYLLGLAFEHHDREGAAQADRFLTMLEENETAPEAGDA